MKKRNLLTLTALCMSLGLVVTACQGPQGQKGETGAKGEKGDTGAKGDKGDKGDKGEDGKTYQAVIVLGSNVTGGKIKQDKYFVQPGETFTLTFEPTKEGSVITEFEVNGEAVEIDPEATSWSYTSTSTDAGWQVTSAVFSTVEDYLNNSIVDHYKAMCKADLGLVELLGTVGSYKTTVSDYSGSLKTGKYSDDACSVVTTVAKKANEAKTTLDNLSAKSTVKEKLAKASELIEAANKAVDEAYAKLIESKKKLAVKDFESGVNTLVKTTQGKYFFDDESKASLLADGKAQLEAASTLQGLNEVYAESFKDEDGNDAKGSYFTLLSQQTKALNTLYTSLKSYSTTDAALMPYGNDAYAYYRQLDLISKLAAYGVSVDTLPASIAEEYASKIISSRSLEKDSDGKIVLEENGKKAIENATKNVKTALYKGIVAAYNAEVDALSSDVASASTKTTLKAAIDKEASDWKNGTSNNVKIAEDYLGLATVNSTDTSYSFNFSNSNSLVAKLEAVLSGDGVTAEIKAERLNNVLASYKTKWTAELASVLANDTDYADAMSFTYKDKNKYTLNNGTLLELGDNKIENFAFSNSLSASHEYSSEVSEAATYTDSDIEIDNQYKLYSAKAVFEALVNADASDKVSIKTISNGKAKKAEASYTALDAKQWAEGVDGAITQGYKEFLKEFQSQIKGKLSYTAPAGVSQSYITSTAISDTFDDNTLDRYDDVSVSTEKLKELGTKAFDSLSVLQVLDKGLTDYVTEKANTSSTEVIVDNAFNKKYIDSKVGVFYNEIFGKDGVLSKIITGEYSESDVSTFVSFSNLEEVYVRDTKDYATRALERLDTTVSNLIQTNDSLDLNDVTLMLARLAEVKTVVNVEEGVFQYVSAFNKYIAKEEGATYTSADKSKVYNLNVAFGLINYPGYNTTELTIDKIDDFYNAALWYVQFGFATLVEQ